ncbi:MAG TPA: sn-glycerol-3-phosphate ABC transporter ATP-binding protein UgpC [Solirubrobacteraceae bacterium]|jgi:multiple sugar transport system ATP-binding protein
MAEIEITEVSKRYRDGTVAVRDFGLSVADGEFMILVGPSGCGKTTLLRMIAGLEEITAGTIRIGDRVVNDLTPRDRDIAMVFQNYALYPHMTVAKNMGFALRRSGVPGAEIRERVQHAAGLLGITDQLERKPSNLSGGQRQRVAMGRAIVRDPQAFLMDEPLSNLDAKLRIQMRAEIVRIQRRLSTTTVYVTHDQTEAMTLGDRLAVMRDGVLQQVGTPSELYERPRNLFVAGFIGAPAMNFLAGEIVDGSLRFPLATVRVADVVEGAAGAERSGRVIVGIRPEDFEDAAVAGDRGRGVTVEAMIDVLESTGSDIYAHLSLNGENGLGELDEPVLAELAQATVSDEGETAPPGGPEVIARVDASSSLAEGRKGDLWLDISRIHLFDPSSGERLQS